MIVKVRNLFLFVYNFKCLIQGFILDWIVDLIGALIGRQECSEKVACRAGRLAQEKIPGSQMMIVMLETFIPPGLLQWFSVLKSSVMSHFDACDVSYHCDFDDVKYD